MPRYTYLVNGTGANDQPWFTVGEVTAHNIDLAIRETRLVSFNQLTQGKAVYGKPGTTCNGPYKITRFYLEMVKEDG